MKKIIFLILFSFGFIILISFMNRKSYAWLAESGTGAVSANEVIVRASLEATEVLRSDTLSNLLGQTNLGGSVNYASFNSGGVISERNVTTSRDAVLLRNDQFLAWLTAANGANGSQIRLGLSADDVFTIANNTNLIGTASLTNAAVSSTLRGSGDTILVRLSSPTVHVPSGGILRSSSDTVLSSSSMTNVHIITGGLLRSSTDTALTNVSEANTRISGTLSVSGATSLVGGISGGLTLAETSMTTTKISQTISVSGNSSFVGGISQIGRSTVVGLPAVSSNISGLYLATDAANATDCTVGGGPMANLCFSSGVGVWVDA